MTKVFLWMIRIAEGWISSFINCFQYFFWCICSQWFLIGSSQIKMTRFLIVSYTTRIQWQLFIPPSFISSGPLDRWSTCLLRQILFLLREDRIKNPNLMNLQGKGLSYLSPEVLYFWQIWNQRISELIMSHDYVIMNLQGDCPQYLGDISLYEEWTGVSLKISENENHVINAIYLKNQDITPWKSLTQVLTRESWKKGNLMTEPHNPQRKQMEEKLDGCARCDDSFLQTFRDYDNSQECKGEELCRYTNCRKHLVIKSTVKHSHVVHAVWHAFGCNNSGMGFTDDARVHHSAHTGGKSYKHHLYGRDFSQSSERTVHDKTHSGEKTVKVKSGLRAADRTQTFLGIPVALQETSPINAWNVAKASVAIPLFTTIAESTRGRCPTPVMCVGRGSDSGHSCVSVRGSTVGKDCISAPSVGRTLIRAPTFLSIRRSTQGRNPTNAASAENASVPAQISKFTRSCTWGTSLTGVTSVGRGSAKAHTCTFTRGSTLGRNPTNVMCAERLSTTAQFCILIREFTQEKSLTRAKCVVRASVTAPMFTYIREITPKRSHINATSVGRASVGTQIFTFISQSTQERGPISGRSVGRASVVTHIFLPIREFIGMRWNMHVMSTTRLRKYIAWIFLLS